MKFDFDIFREFDNSFVSITFHCEFGRIRFEKVFTMESEFSDILFTN